MCSYENQDLSDRDFSGQNLEETDLMKASLHREMPKYIKVSFEVLCRLAYINRVFETKIPYSDLIDINKAPNLTSDLVEGSEIILVFLNEFEFDVDNCCEEQEK
jgi:uncharacterized protein YjbI with pentapeptide repeats